MKICRYDNDQVGLVDGDAVVDITPVYNEVLGRETRLGDPLIHHLDEIRQRVKDARGLKRTPLSQVALKCPMTTPSKIIAAPVNYRKHIEEMQQQGLAAGFEMDIQKAGLFLKATSALAGPSDGISLRFPERRNDHEVEIVAIIGKAGTDIPESEALEHVAAYTLGLDMTVRGKEDRSFRKSIDSFAVLGPWLVTADEIADPTNLDFNLSVNGEVRQQANTSDMVFDVARLIAFASTFYTLQVGDVLYTGSPAGVGPVHAGDKIEANAPSIGSMTVDVRNHAKRPQKGA